jgi:hypothetical protein
VPHARPDSRRERAQGKGKGVLATEGRRGGCSRKLAPSSAARRAAAGHSSKSSPPRVRDRRSCPAKSQTEPAAALEALNKLLKRTDLIAYLDASGRCYLRNTGTGVTSSTMPQQPRPPRAEEHAAVDAPTGDIDEAAALGHESKSTSPHPI